MSNVASILDMTAAAMPDQVAFADDHQNLTYSELRAAAAGGAAVGTDVGAELIVYLGANGVAFPTAIFSAALADVPLLPLNYRATDEQLRALVARHGRVLAITDPGSEHRLSPVATQVLATDNWLEQARPRGATADFEVPADGDRVAIMLYTSGTTALPKAALLRHRHLSSYLLANVDFCAAEPAEASLVSVPPYHIAGVSNALSATFAARRVRYLANFKPARWIDLARQEAITHALVVPTMLDGITTELAHDGGEIPSLRHLAYGGARMPATVLARALQLFPAVSFVNAYGLTETSSTVAVLGPADHREAAESSDPAVRARLSSAGRVVDGVELEVRGAAGEVLPAGEVGDLFVRGPQVSGEYAEGPVSDPEGWFATRDRAWVDQEGFLFIEGRADDTIIRGGENIAPAEIEDVLRGHTSVADAAVVGLPDDRWGQRIAAVVVARHGHTVDTDQLKEHVRKELRSSKTPDEVVVWSELPHTATGKLLRREVVAALSQRG